MEEAETAHARGNFFDGLLAGLVALLLIWGVKIFETYAPADLSSYGLYPRDWNHLYGIMTMPFLHGSWQHLLGNSTPVLVLVMLMYWMYKPVFARASVMMLVLSGLWTWLFARPSFHIGASGMIYAYASFIFFAGVISRNYRMLAISLLVIFLYGSLVWGVFPVEAGISWEAHLMGLVAGLITAVYYREKLPARERKVWEDEEEDEDEAEAKPLPEGRDALVHYYYREVNRKDDDISEKK